MTVAWIDAARAALETHGMVMVHDDGTWNAPTERDWAAFEVTEYEEIYGRSDVDEYGRARPTEEAEGVLLDMQTANMLVTVHDALNDTNRAKFAGLPLLAAVGVGWKLVERTAS